MQKAAILVKDQNVTYSATPADVEDALWRAGVFFVQRKEIPVFTGMMLQTNP